MTREQDLERQLADWLVDGPSTAPAEVVEQALERTAGRRQRRGAWRWLALPLERVGHWFATYRMARVSAFAAVLAGILLTSAIVSTPFLGGGVGTTPTPGPTPTLAPPPVMDNKVPRGVAGTATVDIESETQTELVRSIELATGDLRVAGHARQELTVLVQMGDAAQMHGTMRLRNDWGAWEGPVDIIRYPSGEEYEYASLMGSGAYAGLIYEHVVRQATAEAERTVAGAIWPDEPPPLLDPSVLP